MENIIYSYFYFKFLLLQQQFLSLPLRIPFIVIISFNNIRFIVSLRFF